MTNGIPIDIETKIEGLVIFNKTKDTNYWTTTLLVMIIRYLLHTIIQ